MESFTPILTNFDLLVGEKIMSTLSKRGFSPFITDWGKDRLISLQDWDTPIKKQWNGTCSSFATIAAIENKLKGKFHLSERSLWDFYGVYSTKEAICAAQNFFILEEQYWPQFQPRFDERNIGKGRFKIISIEYLDNNFEKVMTAIDNGNPCIVAMQTPEDLYNGKAQVERTSRILKGGHAICVSGYKVENGKGYFLVKNSWGTGNGDMGYQFVDFNLFDHKGYVTFWELKEVFDRGDQQAEFITDDYYLTSYADE